MTRCRAPRPPAATVPRTSTTGSPERSDHELAVVPLRPRLSTSTFATASFAAQRAASEAGPERGPAGELDLARR